MTIYNIDLITTLYGIDIKSYYSLNEYSYKIDYRENNLL